MARLNLEELGLLQVLERIERGETMLEPAVRYGLTTGNLIENDPPALSPLGERVLGELRLRSMPVSG